MTSDDLSAHKDAQHKVWTNAAETWHASFRQMSSMMQPVTEELVKAARVSDGMRVLDLACGSGEPALTIAKRVAPDGVVVATDFVAEMVRTAEVNARDAGITNISFREVDADAIPYPD